MEVRLINVFIYQSQNGHRPYSEWLENFRDKKIKGIIRARLNRIRLGNLGDCRAIGEGVFEFRIDYGPGFRIYFGKETEGIVILLCGGTKKSQRGDVSFPKIQTGKK